MRTAGLNVLHDNLMLSTMSTTFRKTCAYVLAKSGLVQHNERAYENVRSAACGLLKLGTPTDLGPEAVEFDLSHTKRH